MLLQRVIGVHAYLPFEHLRATGAAHARLACVRHVDTACQHYVQHRISLKAYAQLALNAVGNHRNDGGVASIVRLGARTYGVRNSPRHAEQFLVYFFNSNACDSACDSRRLDHRGRSTNVDLVDTIGVDQTGNDARELRAVNATVGHRRFLHLAAQGVNQLKTAQKAIA